MARRRGGDRFDGGLGRGNRADSFRRGLPRSSGIYPTKGKGWGQQGEAAYPDALATLDRNSSWQAWRNGMRLARDGLIGAAERFTAVEVLGDDPFQPGHHWRLQRLLLAGFTSKQSPEGRWTVAVQERGAVVLPVVLSSVMLQSDWLRVDDEGRSPARRLLTLRLGRRSDMQLHRVMIGELFEDSAVGVDSNGKGVLADDDADGTALLCVGIDEGSNSVLFDAEWRWRRQRLPDGRLQWVKEAVPADVAPAALWRVGRYLTQSTTMACNCPAYMGVVFADLSHLGRLGRQSLYPQETPAGLGGHDTDEQMLLAEGTERRFNVLSWSRTPELDCKHCHAVRWALGCPLKEPSDLPTLQSQMWSSAAGMDQVEGFSRPLARADFLERLRDGLLNERAFSGLDVTLLAAATGECIGVLPQRVPLGVQSMGGIGRMASRALIAEPVLIQDRRMRSQQGQERLHEQHYSADPLAISETEAGDWWVGRGTSREVRAFDAPGHLLDARVIRPLTAADDLPQVIP